jgi:hypothetical protein
MKTYVVVAHKPNLHVYMKDALTWAEARQKVRELQAAGYFPVRMFDLAPVA